MQRIQTILKNARESTQSYQEKLAKEQFFQAFKNQQREKVVLFSNQKNQNDTLPRLDSEQLSFPFMLPRAEN